MRKKVSERKVTSGTSVKDDEVRKAKKAKEEELFAKMAKVRTYPIDHRPPEPTEGDQ